MRLTIMKFHYNVHDFHFLKCKPKPSRHFRKKVNLNLFNHSFQPKTGLMQSKLGGRIFMLRWLRQQMVTAHEINNYSLRRLKSSSISKYNIYNKRGCSVQVEDILSIIICIWITQLEDYNSVYIWYISGNVPWTLKSWAIKGYNNCGMYGQP